MMMRDIGGNRNILGRFLRIDFTARVLRFAF